MSEKQELCFSIDRDGLRIVDVQATAKQAWKQMREPGTVAHANALKLGVDLETLPKQMDRVIHLRPHGAGVTTVDLLVLVAGKVAWDLWKHVVLAHIRHLWGDHALREKRIALRRAGTKKKTRARRPAAKNKQTSKKKSARQP